MKSTKFAPLLLASLIASCAVDDAERLGRAGAAAGVGGSGSEAGPGSGGSGDAEPASGGSAGNSSAGSAGADTGGAGSSESFDASAEAGGTSATGGAGATGGSSGGGGGGSAELDATAGSAGTAVIVDATAETTRSDAALVADVAATPEAGTCAGESIHFNGTDTTYGSITRPVADDFTIEAWIRTTSSAAGTNFWQGLGLVYGDVVGTTNDYGLSILNGRLAWGVGNPDLTLPSVTPVNTGEWIHFAVTRTKSTGKSIIYVNGKLDAQTMVAGNTGSLTASATLTIGGNVSDKHWYNGDLDELRIWNTARSLGAIQATMKTRLNGNEAGLVAYYRFDQMGGSTVADEQTIGTKYPMTLTNSTALAWTAGSAPICP